MTPDVAALRAELADLNRRRAEIHQALGLTRSGASRKIKAENLSGIVEQVAEGVTLEALAVEHGVSRQRIDQIVAAVDRSASVRGRKIRRALSLEQRAVKAEVAMVQTALRRGSCLTCTGPVTRVKNAPAGRATCSPRCAELWAQCRLHLDDRYRERHRKAQARCVLKSGSADPVARRHAERVLAGTAGTRGRWTLPDGKVAAGLEQVAELRRTVAESGESWWT